MIEPISRTHDANVPLWGNATLVNGRGFFHQHLVNDACYELGPPRHWLPESERGWLVLFREALAPLHSLRPEEASTFLALNEPVLNASAVRLAALRDGLEGGVYEPVETGGDDTVAAYEAFFRDREADLVLTGSREGCHFGPTVTQARVEAAASGLGFTPALRLPMPDGRELRVWTRSGAAGETVDRS